jgi:hypothetical protein
MSRIALLTISLLACPLAPALSQDTVTARKKPALELSEPVTLSPQFPVPRCVGYVLQVVNRTGYPLRVSLGKTYLGTVQPDERNWTFRIPSELADLIAVRGFTFESVGGPPPPTHLLWDQFRVFCGR